MADQNTIPSFKSRGGMAVAIHALMPPGAHQLEVPTFIFCIDQVSQKDQLKFKYSTNFRIVWSRQYEAPLKSPIWLYKVAGLSPNI